MTEKEIREKALKLVAHGGISPEFSFLSLENTLGLLDTLTRMRSVLHVIEAEAGKHCDERLRGWERWQKVRDWTKEALGEGI